MIDGRAGDGEQRDGPHDIQDAQRDRPECGVQRSGEILSRIVAHEEKKVRYGHRIVVPSSDVWHHEMGMLGNTSWRTA